tara:strand:- start:63 stop:290 length:228 start_codon:yes stop_codon:yes gene_type:complete
MPFLVKKFIFIGDNGPNYNRLVYDLGENYLHEYGVGNFSLDRQIVNARIMKKVYNKNPTNSPNADKLWGFLLWKG